jgi:hypothetical protein
MLMKVRTYITGLVVLALIPTCAAGKDLYSLIQKGKLQEANDSLSAQSSAALRDGRLLYLQSLVEKDADEAARLMRAALNASVPARYREDIYMRLAQYYLMTRDFRKLSQIVNDYRARWEAGRYEGEMLRMTALLSEMEKDYETALRQTDRYLLRFSEGEAEQWGEIDKARILWANNKGVGASKTLRDLSREKSGVGVSQALYLLGIDAVRRDRTDDAVFYYNLLRDGYPQAVGLDHLVDALSGMSVATPDDSRAEEITNTFYSVKVGVFSSRSNADNFAKKFKGYDKKVQIGSKTISGKKYRVVYVGRFKSFEEAFKFKSQLESTHDEVYQVVAR